MLVLILYLIWRWGRVLICFLKKFYWSPTDLQCCVNFSCTAKWLSFIYMCVYIYIYVFFFIFFSIIVYQRILNIVPCAIQLEKAMAPHSSTLAWKIPWMEEPGRLQSIGLPRVGHDWATSLSLFTFMHWRRTWQPTPVILPGESQGRGAWWAAIYGVTQSWTWLKQLSSSSAIQ